MIYEAAMVQHEEDESLMQTSRQVDSDTIVVENCLSKYRPGPDGKVLNWLTSH